MTGRDTQKYSLHDRVNAWWESVKLRPSFINFLTSVPVWENPHAGVRHNVRMLQSSSRVIDSIVDRWGAISINYSWYLIGRIGCCVCRLFCQLGAAISYVLTNAHFGSYCASLLRTVRHHIARTFIRTFCKRTLFASGHNIKYRPKAQSSCLHVNKQPDHACV